MYPLVDLLKPLLKRANLNSFEKNLKMYSTIGVFPVPPELKFPIPIKGVSNW